VHLISSDVGRVATPLVDRVRSSHMLSALALVIIPYSLSFCIFPRVISAHETVYDVIFPTAMLQSYTGTDREVQDAILKIVYCLVSPRYFWLLS